MKIIPPSVQLLDEVDGAALLKRLERCGRVCYKSEGRIAEGTAETFVAGLLRRGHESVIEHEKLTVLFTCDRGVTHEIVRHRIASYSQESTRYCNYSGDKFGNELTFIKPCFWAEDAPAYQVWKEQMAAAERAYLRLLELGATPQEARSVLPNSLKAELVATMDLREWRHFLRLRTDAAAHPQMREVADMLLAELRRSVPVIFDDIGGN